MTGTKKKKAADQGVHQSAPENTSVHQGAPHNDSVDAHPGDPLTVRVAYHRGPPSIVFYGREWRRGMPKRIPVEDWIAMNERPDITGFNFSESDFSKSIEQQEQ